MPSNHTANYRLSQWEKSDKVQMEDFNADNAKIDAVLGDHTAKLNTLVAASPKHGDCQIYTTSYTGDGTYGEEHPIQLTFPYPPMLVAVQNYHGVPMVLVRDCPAFIHSGYELCTVTWSGNTVSYYSANSPSQMNNVGRLFHVVALCSKS